MDEFISIGKIPNPNIQIPNNFVMVKWLPADFENQ